MRRSEEESGEERNGGVDWTRGAEIDQASENVIVCLSDKDVVERDITVAEIKGVEEGEIVEDGEEIREMKIECISSGRYLAARIKGVQRLSFPFHGELS